METITIVLILMLAVVLSDSLSRALPWPIPLPLVQIGLGAVIGLMTDFRVELNPEIFFTLFLPPLLFLDGWRIPKQGLFRDQWTIIELALGLVVVTVIGLGYFIHWMIPTMPLAVAFALAAVLSPTDPVAVSAIAARVPIPKRLMHILEGESLLNDASGLVCLRFAVAAALTGVFSVQQALGTFVWLAAGGLAIGVAVTLGITKAKSLITKHFGEDAGSQILISLLIPFGAYLAAEHVHCSGILAAVAAGITMSFTELGGQAMAVTRVRRSAVWDTVQFAINGIIFVLLGEQLPGIFSKVAETSQSTNHENPWWLAVYALAINAVLALGRLLWVWLSLKWTLFRSARRGEGSNAPNWRITVAASLAGVRGTITLAGVLTLPLTMPDGSPFPVRDLAIFLAACVIILSLTGASIGLPRLLRGLQIPADDHHNAQEDLARAKSAEAAIRAVENTLHGMAGGRSDADRYIDAGTRIMDLYRYRIKAQSGTGEEREVIRQTDEIERQLRLAGLEAERDELFRLARAGEIGDDVLRQLVREVDLADAQQHS
ncbi:Na+/H+ antiporter [Bryobacter aggregatus]|uniref:Na+/H+ antiporter n=1 Tax=Bryobacter aggregatus TaxID=360054 RepID=UPI0004E0FD4F|nr:Na+/H+ antiporter [Bryobacter aggregatus]